MVDPASVSQQQQQQQQQHQQQQPPKLSITVVPLDPLDDSLDFGCEDNAAGPLKPLSESSLTRATLSLYNDLIDEVILGAVFEVHRGAKLGLTALLEDGPMADPQNDFDNDETTRSSAGDANIDGDLAVSDFLSAVPALNSKKPVECVCPNCQRNMAASRFAPHLEKCMGMGRNSSRLASRRIASSASRQVDLASDDDLDDDDWMTGGGGDRQDRVTGGDGSGSGSKKRRHHHLHKKDKNSPRRKKWKNGDSSSAPQSSTLTSSSSSVPGMAGADGTESQSSGNGGNAAIETMTLTERRAILSTMCGVVSEHTGRMCTRSLRCPQHTDSQRKYVRQTMLDAGDSSDGSALVAGAAADKEKDMIDVDTWEEGDSLASLLTAQSHDVPTPGAEASPAESTSTTASSTSSSAKRPQTKGAKKGGGSGGKKFKNET